MPGLIEVSARAGELILTYYKHQVLLISVRRATGLRPELATAFWGMRFSRLFAGVVQHSLPMTATTTRFIWNNVL